MMAPTTPVNNKVNNGFSDESKSERQIVFTLMEKKDSFYNLNKNKNVFSFFADGYKFLKKSEDITSLSNNIYSLFYFFYCFDAHINL